MTASDVYLFCFFFGFLFSLVSVLSGHFHFHGHQGHGHGHGHGHHGHTHGAHGEHDGGPPWLNMGTVSAFLAWFGGAGYLASHYYRVYFLGALVLAMASGVAGASIVFWFLSKVLMKGREDLDPASFEMVGVLGKVSSTIRPTGMGEIVFTQNGFHRASPARSESGSRIANGAEVVVTRYEHGVAYVRLWDELAGLESEQVS